MNAARKYTPQVIDMISKYIHLPKDELAKKIGVKKQGLIKKIHLLRKQGKIIPLKNAPVGTIHERQDGKFRRKFIKKPNGKWQRLPLTKEDIEARRPFYKVSNRPPKPPKVQKIKPAKVGKQPREVKVYKRRIIDLSKLNKIYIPEMRLTVYADPKKSEKSVREKYLKTRVIK